MCIKDGAVSLLTAVTKFSRCARVGVVIGSHNTWHDEGTFRYNDGHFTSNGGPDKNTAGKWGLAHCLPAHPRWGEPPADRLRGPDSGPRRPRAQFAACPDCPG